MLILHSSATRNEQTKVWYDRNYFRNGLLLIHDESQWNEMRHDVDKKKGFGEEWNERSRKWKNFFSMLLWYLRYFRSCAAYGLFDIILLQ